jgi:uncharacterized protein YndB with AHSA1/START domain
MIPPINNRTDTASRLINAPARKIYKALLDPQAVAQWRPPKGMIARVYEFNPREGGTYRMAFDYLDGHTVRGKTSENSDIVRGRFLELKPGKSIVELVTFESEDSSFAGEMKITMNLLEVPGGTEVTFLAENVPVGIKPEDHYKDMASTLQNLAAFTE